MKRFIIPVSFVILCLVNNASSQITQKWVARYNGPGNGEDRARSLAVDGSGNVYVTGWSKGSGSNDDYATIKYNSSGVQQWVRRYNGLDNGIDQALSIKVDNSGNVYVTGFSFGITTKDDFTTIKYNSSGVQLWVSMYNGPGNSIDQAYSIAVDASGNVYVTGVSGGSGNVEGYATVKYNSSGVQQWVARYEPGAKNASHSIVVDSWGYVYVTGVSWGNGTQLDYATIKYNPSGVQQWVRRYDGTGFGDEANSIKVNLAENVFVTGESDGETKKDYATIKYGPSGLEWAQRYNGPGNGDDVAHSISLFGPDKIYVTGESFGSGTNLDYATVKYNSSGIQQWVARYNGPGNGDDIARSIISDGSDVYITGMSWGVETDKDYATIKYNSSGIQQWVARYNGPGNAEDIARLIAVDGSGNVYVTGASFGNGTGYDFATIKYSPIITSQSNQLKKRN